MEFFDIVYVHFRVYQSDISVFAFLMYQLKSRCTSRIHSCWNVTCEMCIATWMVTAALSPCCNFALVHEIRYHCFNLWITWIISGELEVASAKNVVLYTTLINKRRDRDDGILGLLVVTNFKLSFLTGNNDQVHKWRMQLLLLPSIQSNPCWTFSAKYHVPRKSISQLQRCNPTKYRLHIPNCRPKETINKSILKNQFKIGRRADRLQGNYFLDGLMRCVHKLKIWFTFTELQSAEFWFQTIGNRQRQAYCWGIDHIRIPQSAWFAIRI